MDFEFEVVDELGGSQRVKSEPEENEESENARLVEPAKKLCQKKWDDFLSQVDREMDLMINLLETQKGLLVKEHKLSYARWSGVMGMDDLTQEDVDKLKDEISSTKFSLGRFEADSLKSFFDEKYARKSSIPSRHSNNSGKSRYSDSGRSSPQTDKWPARDSSSSQHSSSRKRPAPTSRDDSRGEQNVKKFKTSEQADAILAGPEDIDKLGEPFGKELTGLNLVELAGSSKILKASLVTSFGDFKMPMGVDLMKDEVVICNMNNNEVQFCDLNGQCDLKISKAQENLNRPSNALVLLDGRILICDDNGVNLYDIDGNFTRVIDLPESGKIYGILPVRENGGMLGIFLSTRNRTNKIIFFDRELEKVVRQVTVKLPSDYNEQSQSMIRFTEVLGNTIYLSDMFYDHNIIWMVDLNGNVRSVAGVGGKGQQPGQFVQAAGITADNSGNFLTLCSKTCRVMAFSRTGEFLCEVQFPEGVVERPTDLSLNDDGMLAITSLRGKVYILRLEEGDPSRDDWPTKTSFVNNTPRRDRGRGTNHGTGRGSNRGTNRGTGRGTNRGSNRGSRGRGGRGGHWQDNNRQDNNRQDNNRQDNNRQDNNRQDDNKDDKWI